MNKTAGLSKSHLKKLIKKELQEARDEFITGKLKRDSLSPTSVESLIDPLKIEPAYQLNNYSSSDLLIASKIDTMGQQILESVNNLDISLKNIEDSITKLEKSNTKLEERIGLMDVDVKQFSKLSARQNVLLERIIDKIYPAQTKLNIFPIKTLEELKNLNEKLSNTSTQERYTYIKEFIGHTHISKIINSLFTEDVLMQINWSGSNNMFALNSVNLFSTDLFEVVKSENFGYKEFQDCMKKSFRLAKNHIYLKRHYRKKKDE